MTRLRPLAVAMAPYLLAVGCGEAGPERPGGAPSNVVPENLPLVSGTPDIVLITIDTIRADHLSCYGYFRKTSPHLDTLAEESLLFEHCLAPMATTLPTHTSLFTATWPLEHGVLANVIERRKRYKRSPALITFTEYVKELGYQTAAFVSALPLKKQFDLDPGFDVYMNPKGPAHRANVATSNAIQWLSRYRPEPVFLWVHYFDPHSPYDPPGDHGTVFESDSKLERYVEQREFVESATRPTGQVNTLREGINTYDGEVRFMDQELGRLLDVLRKRERWDETVVIVVGDHGEGLNQHAEPGHGLVWREQLHVPFLVRAPGIPAGRVPALLSVVDVLPTVLGLLELPDEERFLAQASGRDALAAGYAPAPIFAQTSARQEKYGEDLTFSLTTARWKLIVTEDGDEKLFDLGADPHELEDVAEKHPKILTDMRRRLDAQVAEQRRRGETFQSGSIEELSEEDASGLEGLGYVSDEENE